jgi:hypothetical protein
MPRYTFSPSKKQGALFSKAESAGSPTMRSKQLFYRSDTSRKKGYWKMEVQNRGCSDLRLKCPSSAHNAAAGLLCTTEAVVV